MPGSLIDAFVVAIVNSGPGTSQVNGDQARSRRTREECPSHFLTRTRLANVDLANCLRTAGGQSVHYLYSEYGWAQYRAAP